MPPHRRWRKGTRQRFYARNALKTTSDPCTGRLMRSFWANRAHPSYQTRIHPALTSFADECCATLGRLLAYVGTLALVAMLGVRLWAGLPVDDSNEPQAKVDWGVADRSHPAFAIS